MDEYQDFLSLHKPQLVNAGIPEHYYRRVYEKIDMESYDSGKYFMMLTDGNDWEVQATATIDASDANTVFLIDHCWTFYPEQIKKAFRSTPGLASRIANIVGHEFPDWNGYESEDETEAEAMETLTEDLSQKIWTMAETYTIQKDDEKLTVCYIMDEFGSRIHHSESPNMKFAPFFHITKQFAVTLMWPVVDEIEIGACLTRDATMGETDPHKRAARLAIYPNEINIDRNQLKVHFEKLDPYKMYGRKEQTLPENVPDNAKHPASLRMLSASVEDPIKVASDQKCMNDSITDPLLTVVDSESEADVIFSSNHFDQFRQLFENCPAKIVNQFPSENIICCKDLLLKVARRCTINVKERERSDEIIIERLNSMDPTWAEDIHSWWSPIGFDLVNELPVFVRCFLERQDKGLDNTWIIKPWNLSRGRYTYVTSNLAMIVKLAYTSPKVVQKYIERPVLFYRGDVGRVKFDIRYVILLKSVEPLILYKYNVFWLRFANKPFSMDEFDEYEKHFTVMNYVNEAELKEIGDIEFLSMFDQQYPDHDWAIIDKKACQMLRECFESAASLSSPKGLGHSAQSRAIYAVDFMLKWNDDETEMIPQLLEVNFNPDNNRACKYHPNFYNHCLKALLFDSTEEIPVTLIN